MAQSKAKETKAPEVTSFDVTLKFHALINGQWVAPGKVSVDENTLADLVATGCCDAPAVDDADE